MPENRNNDLIDYFLDSTDPHRFYLEPPDVEPVDEEELEDIPSEVAASRAAITSLTEVTPQRTITLKRRSSESIAFVTDFCTNAAVDKEVAMPVHTKLLADFSNMDPESPIVYTRHMEKLPTFLLPTGIEVTVAMDPRPLIKSGEFIEFPTTSLLIHKSKLNTVDYESVKKSKHCFRPTKARKVDFITKSKSYTLTEGKKYSFGLELETSSGYLPGWLDLFYNYEAVKDGSLRDENGDLWGGEYVTGILAGDEGFKVAKSFINELAKRCTIDKKCGVHVHIGSEGGFSNESVVYLYKLCLDVERDIFNMLPASRRKNVYCKTLKKFNFDNFIKATNPIHYKRQLEHLYDQIAGWVSNRSDFNPAIYSKFDQHPDGPKCGYNQSTARYSWVNLVPTLFNTRGNESYTIEFRPHSGTLNYIKIRNWTLICMAIVHVAENYPGTVKSQTLTLKQVIELAYPKKSKELIKYIDDRTKLFSDAKFVESVDYDDNVNDNNESFTTI